MKTLNRILLLVGLMLAGFVVLMLCMQLTLNMNSPYATLWLKCYQILQSILVFALPAIICAMRWSNNKPLQYLHLNKATSGFDYLWVFVLIIGAFPVINLLVHWNGMMHLPDFLSGIENWMRTTEDANEAMLERFLDVKTIGGLLFNILVMAITPAICEEFLFRGALQPLISEKFGIHWGIWITAIIFSAIHFQFYGFIPRMLLGAVFGYLLYYSGSLFVPMLAHLLHNTLSIVFYYIGLKYTLSFNFDNLGVTTYPWLSSVGLILFLIAFYFIRKGRIIQTPKQS